MFLLKGDFYIMKFTEKNECLIYNGEWIKLSNSDIIEIQKQMEWGRQYRITLSSKNAMFDFNFEHEMDFGRVAVALKNAKAEIKLTNGNVEIDPKHVYPEGSIRD